MEIRGSCKHYLPLHVPVIVFFNERFSFPESSADLLFFSDWLICFFVKYN